MRLLTSIDYPPVWLAGFLGLSWAVGRLVPLPGLPVTGLIMTGIGLLLMVLAVAQMLLARTTFIPRREPGALVSRGIFALTRNPIYLGDALVLAGLSLYWQALAALPLVALFVWVINRRFIAGEETALRKKFGPAYDRYLSGTRRWL